MATPTSTLPAGSVKALGHGVTVGEPTPIPNRPAVADPTKEYVSGGALSWLSAFLRVLPDFIDDVSRDFGDDIYERMLHDPQCASAINTIKHGILANPLSLPAVAANGEEPTPQAAEIAAFCARVLDTLETPLHDVLWNLLDALAYGSKVAEKVYAPGTEEDAGRLVLARLKVKPRRATAFVVDAFGNIAGLMGLIPGVSWTTMTQNIFSGADPKLVPNYLPRDKFVILTCRQTDSDPHGQSLLRPAYYAWYMKTQVAPEYLKYLTLYAVGILVGTTAPESFADTPAFQADGVTPVLDSTGNQVYLTPQQTMLKNLLGLHNGTAIVLPAGALLDTLKPAGDGKPFLDANDFFDRQIEKAITGQTLATSEAQHDTRAASQTHQDVLGGLTGYGRSIVETMLYRDVLCPLVAINYGEGSVALTPRPVLSDVEQQDTVALWGAVGALNTSGYLDPSQKIALDAQVGLPERSPDSVAREVERQDAPPVTADAAASQPGDRPSQPVEGIKKKDAE